MDDVLLTLIFERLAEAKLDSAVEDTVLAACESRESLEKLLADTGFVPPTKPAAVTAEQEPAGAYLTSIGVQGFRGVGNRVSIELDPGPGLTAVVGRNGSGKSSIAEGFEVLLTGRMRRWDDKSEVWKTGWKNLHAGLAPELDAELVVEGQGKARVIRTWSGEDLADSSATAQVAGQKKAGFSSLGWDQALVAYRPILAHSELESFFGRPSDLYDLLSSVLGLDELTEVSNRLARARLDSEKEVKASKLSLTPLLVKLRSLDDERAARCLALLTAKTQDFAAVEAVVTGATAPVAGGSLNWLRELTSIVLPSEDEVFSATTELGEAISGLNALSGTDAGRADETAKLLRASLAHFESHGGGPCPVCGTEGMLDDAWAERTKGIVTELETEAKAVRKAIARRESAVGRSRRLVLNIPTCLATPAEPMPAVANVAAAWAAWSTEALDVLEPDQLVDHLRTNWAELSTSVANLKQSAEAELKAKEGEWTPIALDITKWCTKARQVQDRAAHVPNLKRAEEWLKKTTRKLLNDRLDPLANEARAIWDELRQGSNVALSNIHLEGTSTHRHVEFDVEIDGSEGSALGVMSQGEVNALALSVFIPRAMTPDSPFRFLLIDDPIQAMDPSKVDGFARVLEKVAASRQVIVFTHDNRLPEAIRRLNIAAKVLEVTRRPKSQLEVILCSDPVTRAFGEAYAVAADDHLAPQVAERVVGPLCRHGIEAAFLERARRDLFAAGMDHAEVDRRVAEANTTNKKAALGLFGDSMRTADVLPRLNSIQSWVADTFKLVRDSAHVPPGTDLKKLVNDCRQFVKKI